MPTSSMAQATRDGKPLPSAVLGRAASAGRKKPAAVGSAPGLGEGNALCFDAAAPRQVLAAGMSDWSTSTLVEDTARLMTFLSS